MNRIIFLITLFLTSEWTKILAVTYKCKSIKDCSSLDWLMKNKGNVPFKVSNIFKVLGHIGCGYNESEPKILCTDDIVNADDEDETSALRNGVITGYLENEVGCTGSIVYHELKEKTYSISKILQRKRSIGGDVFQIEVIGNCCWKAYDRKSFRGEFELYEPGINICPEIIVKSIKKVDCP
nr:uncharacterized protein LOC121113911 isoform X1 [Lepeophtheirus salmonis]